MSDDIQAKAIDINKLFNGYCIMSFVFPDGSRVESLSTLNPALLDKHGLGSIDGIIDLDVRRCIPDHIIQYLSEIREGTQKTLSRLDTFFEIGGKIGW